MRKTASSNERPKLKIILILVALLASLSFLFGVLLVAGTALWWWGSASDLIFLPPVLINFALMVVESIVLGLFAPLHVWSLFTNFLSYVFILLFFVIEYQLRLYCLASHEHLSFRTVCHLLVSTDLRSLAR